MNRSVEWHQNETNKAMARIHQPEIAKGQGGSGHPSWQEMADKGAEFTTKQEGLWRLKAGWTKPWTLKN